MLFNKDVDAYFIKARTPISQPFKTFFFSKKGIPDFIDDIFDIDFLLNKLKKTIQNSKNDKGTLFSSGVYYSQIGNGFIPIFEKYYSLIEIEFDYDLSKKRVYKNLCPYSAWFETNFRNKGRTEI